MTDQARIWELLEKAAAAVTDEDGHFDQKAFREEFMRLLAEEDQPEVHAALLEQTARRLTDAFVNKRKPRKRGDSDTLFDPGFILPLGEGRRVWMEQATDRDLIKWAALSAENLAKVARAEADRQAYAAKCAIALREHDGWTLGRLEREVLGYIDSDDLDWSDDMDDPGP